MNQFDDNRTFKKSNILLKAYRKILLRMIIDMFEMIIEDIG